MTDEKRIPLVSRRAFAATLSALPGLGALACSKAKADAFACTDVSGLGDADRAQRVKLAYVDNASDPDRRCDRCVQYLEAPEGCGACKLLRGPIHPAGFCKSFAAK